MNVWLSGVVRSPCEPSFSMATNAELGNDRRDEILSYVASFIEEHGHSPTVREVASGVGLSGPGSAHRHLDRLVQEGRLKKVPVTSSSFVYAVPDE